MNDVQTVFEVDTEQPFWYAIHTRSRHEKVVRDQFGAKGITHLLPLHQKRSIWKDRVKMIEVPLFGGYIFGHFALQDRLQHDESLKTKGLKVQDDVQAARTHLENAREKLDRLMSFAKEVRRSKLP